MDATPCILLLVPAGALGGIDLLSFTTTPRFKGIKDLPGGWHFVFTSSTTSLSVRHGAWFRVNDVEETSSTTQSITSTSGSSCRSPDLFVKKWDARDEELVPESDPAEVLRWRANLGAIWRDGLTPYRQSASRDAGDEGDKELDWRALTDAIGEGLLDRVLGGGGGAGGQQHWGLTSASSAARDADDIPGLSNDRDGGGGSSGGGGDGGGGAAWQPEKELELLPVDLKMTWGEGVTGRERTEAAQDRSWALGELVERVCGGREEEVLGELQFAFLMVLTLNNNSCLEQWKRLLELLLTCKKAVVQRAGFYCRFLRLLRLQLQHCQDTETMLFDLNDEGGSLLKRLLRRFRKGLEELEGKGKSDVVDELDELEDFLRGEYGWQLDDSFVRRGMLELEDGEQVEMDVGTRFDEDDEAGEFAPMVVELTEEQAKSLGAFGGEDGSGGAQAAEQHGKRLAKPESGIAGEEVQEESEDEVDLDDMDARY
ncbi:aar2 family protein [Diplodia corticola]|uniref:Aar2 family protein n=1 Tax=Diplodia corticola TaxID=236234 RepID=A0A1J9S469_9PEZI|nr:aar2 family protein [Diplodia corticola]OJD39739.1 aar2 family protein [Diplodia corticola]